MPVAKLKPSTTTVQNAVTPPRLSRGSNIFHASPTPTELAVAELMKALKSARDAIDRKHTQLGGAPGAPMSEVEWGAGDATGFFRQYQGGTIFLKPPAGPCWVLGAILDKYRQLGAEGGFLGYPTTDELPTPNGRGRYNHFEGGSIYWNYDTGAHEVHGAIRDKWAALGWETSWLGFPTSDETDFAEGGRMCTFEQGAIYWWPDTGAIDVGNVAIRYRGLYCFGETDEASAHDEPYVIFGGVSVPMQPHAPPVQIDERSQVYTGVDAGEASPDLHPLYNGIPAGMVVSATLCEHDHGDPNKFREEVKEGVGLAGKGVAAAAGALFGPGAAKACETAWKFVGPALVGPINDLLGTDEDLLATFSMVISAKDMIRSLHVARQNFRGIEYHWESPLLSDGEASYKVYFDIQAV